MAAAGPAYTETTCPLCAEHLSFGAPNKTTEKLANNFREHIFYFEETFRGRMRDQELFTLILQLRQRFIERALDEHGVQYTPWTLPAIRRHYKQRHFYDSMRDTRDQLDSLVELERLMKEAWFRDTPEGTVFDAKLAIEYTKLLKCMQEFRREYDAKLKEQQTQFGEYQVRAIIDAIRGSGDAAGAGAAGVGGPATANAELLALLEHGGL